jgi:hypothetical protein
MPKCDPACDEKSICVPRKNDAGAIVATCTPVARIRIVLSSAAEELRVRIHSLSKESARALIREFIERYCDKPEHEADCKAFKEDLDNVDADVTSKDDKGTTVEIKVGDKTEGKQEGGMSVRFATMAAGSSGVVVNGALNDGQVSGEGYTVGNAPNAGQILSASPVVVVFVAAVAVAVQFL